MWGLTGLSTWHLRGCAWRHMGCLKVTGGFGVGCPAFKWPPVSSLCNLNRLYHQI